ncbi:MAG: putative ABC transport system permease protein [Colwellia sp.]|jgi:putative ABC transport system permease protein
MLSQYFLTALRTFKRQKLHLMLNVFGLSVGLAASILVALYAINESSYDHFQPNAENTYRMVFHDNQSGNEYLLSTPKAYEKIKQLAGVEDVLYLMQTKMFADDKIKISENFNQLTANYAVTENIVDFITLDVISGDLQQSLQKPDHIALTVSEAKRLFGDINIVGQTLLRAKSHQRLTVGAVFKDLRADSHFHFSSLTSFTPYNNIKGNIVHSYVRLNKTDVNKVAESITALIADIWQWRDNYYYLQPLTAIHLGANFNNDMRVGGSEKNLSISIMLSLLLLLISSFNYINMSIAQAGSRAKEVGVRKVLGVNKSQLIVQFLTESVVLVVFATLIACALVELALPSFNQLVDRQISINGWSPFLLPLIIGSLFTGLLSGLYPALFISSFNAKRVLSGDFKRGKTATRVRKSLMVCQCALSLTLIISVLSLTQQLALLNNLPVNYEKSQRLVVVDAPSEQLYNINDLTLYQTLQKLPGVAAVTPSDFYLTDRSNAGFFLESVPGIDTVKTSMAYGGVGFDAVAALGLQLIAGRDFSTEFKADWFNAQSATVAIIIPESTLKLTGFASADEAIGKTWIFSAGPASNVSGRIVGVIKDVKVGSVRHTGAPVVFVCGLPIGGSYSLVIKTNEVITSKVRNDIATLLERKLDMAPVEIQTVSGNYSKLYVEDTRLVNMVRIFCYLAIFLTCIGMFGLAVFNAQLRSKEVAIRKVIGASSRSIVALLGKESMLLVFIAVAIAFPISYFLIDNWLSHFNVRITQSLGVYFVAAFVVLVVTQLTIFIVAYRTANSKPVNVLRSE